MLKITAIGNLTHDVELKMNENTGNPMPSCASPRIAAIRIRTATSSPILSPSRCAVPWPSSVPPMLRHINSMAPETWRGDPQPAKAPRSPQKKRKEAER